MMYNIENMKRRTQVLFEEDEYRRLKALADQQNISFSAAIRERIRRPFRPHTPPVSFLALLADQGKHIHWKKVRGRHQTVDELVYGKPRTVTKR